MQHEGKTVGAFDQQTAHVGHIENTAAAAGGQVLSDDTAGILNGHFPTAKVDHLAAAGQKRLIQLGTLQFRHFNLLLKCYLCN